MDRGSLQPAALPFLWSPRHSAIRGTRWRLAGLVGWIRTQASGSGGSGGSGLVLMLWCLRREFGGDGVEREAVPHWESALRATFLARDRRSGTWSGGQGSSWNDEVHIISRNGADDFQRVPCGLAGLINLGSYLTQYHPVDAWHAPPPQEGQERAMLYPIPPSRPTVHPLQVRAMLPCCHAPSPSPVAIPCPGRQGRPSGRRQVQVRCSAVEGEQ